MKEKFTRPTLFICRSSKIARSILPGVRWSKKSDPGDQGHQTYWCNNKFEIALSAGHPIASICSCPFSSSIHRCHLTLQHSAVTQSSRSTRRFRQKTDCSSVAIKMFLLNKLFFFTLTPNNRQIVLHRLY